ncbi:hypothetical protein NM688_g6324 [Phlebia brevispora]|uniref:Uncharacterized protein n=1 Tax=Phlebia brevispora TaxID=194682 RepID=A0ACC1SHB1_9APHY|nr:hypothetical protein NM688_g6324 [Phlebia brevispora]
MKPREQGGVVDHRLNVYGVEGLKVADLSIPPSNVAANTYSSTLAIAERAAVIIAEDLGVKGAASTVHVVPGRYGLCTVQEGEAMTTYYQAFGPIPPHFVPIRQKTTDVTAVHNLAVALVRSFPHRAPGDVPLAYSCVTNPYVVRHGFTSLRRVSLALAVVHSPHIHTLDRHGPGLVGTFLNIALYGIMCTQCFLYFTKYPNDRPWMKIMVSVLLLADTLNCVFDMWWIYDVLINHFSDPNALKTGNWVFATDPAMVGIIATMVQLFFAWRVKVLTNRPWVVLLIVVTAFGSIFGGIGTAVAIHYVPEFTEFQKFQVVVIVWLICAVICDSAITLSLTWHLRKHKTGFQDTDDILNKIIRLTVQNGLITALWAIIDLISYLATPSGLHLAFNFPLAKLYTNSLMSSLNSRAGWRYQTSESTTNKGGERDQTTRRVRSVDVVNLSTATRPEVFVTVESHEMVDVADNMKLGDDGWPADSTGSESGSTVKQQMHMQYGSAV